jgi:hypothetical protein
MPADTEFSTAFEPNSYGLRSRGFYAAQLGHYLDRFPRGNLLVFIYEELRQEREEEARQELLKGYMSDIRELEALLGRDLSIWYAPRRGREM